MRVLLQRVKSGRVTVQNGNANSERLIAEIGAGIVVLLGIGHEDADPRAAEEHARYLAEKIAHLRIFEDDQGKINRSLLEVGGQAIVVSQFTLYADARKGRRPSFTEAAPPEIAQPVVNRFVEVLKSLGIPTQAGEFGAHMLVEIANDGPVTIWLERT